MQRKKRKIWHSYFDAALLLGTIVTLLFYFTDIFSGAGTIMIASLAASVYILTHKYRHHLTAIGTVTIAYLVAGSVSMLAVYFLRLGSTPVLNQALFLLIILTSSLLWLEIFHPPAVTFGMALVIYQKEFYTFSYVIASSIIMMIAIRLIIYIWHDHLDIKDFFKEFIREEKTLIKERTKKSRKR